MENYKNKLQEYTQKLALPLPVYESVREGLEHIPTFKSYVMVNGVRYESSAGYTKKKDAEQSAAQVAVEDLCNKDSAATPYKLDEVLGKKLLSELLERLGWPSPTFSFTREGPSHIPVFTSTLEINGVTYVGGQGQSKKEAETKVAFAAFQAINTQVDGNCFHLELPAESDETGDLKRDSEDMNQHHEYGSKETEENKQVVQEGRLTESINKRNRNELNMDSKKREDKMKRQRSRTHSRRSTSN